MRPRTLAIVAGAAVAVSAGWALFRPELLFVDKSVNEAFPAAYDAPSAAAAQARILLSGSFHDGAHPTSGMAAIHDVGGKRVLRLSDFATSNGPDVRVLLVAAPDATDNDTVKNSSPIELGSLKGNVGDQNYDIPTGIDLSKYRAVTIWCNRFAVNFGTAPLRTQPL